jgi:hypothetical protein
MSVRINEAGTDNQPANIQRSLGRNLGFRRVPEKHDAVAANADVFRVSARSAAVDYLSALEQKVERLERKSGVSAGPQDDASAKKEWRENRYDQRKFAHTTLFRSLREAIVSQTRFHALDKTLS